MRPSSDAEVSRGFECASLSTRLLSLRMQRKGHVCVACVLSVMTWSGAIFASPAGAAPKPQPSLISFEVKPGFVGCHDGQSPQRATVYWHVTHEVSRVTLAGMVDTAGTALEPVVVVSKPHLDGVRGSRTVYVLCNGATQVLTLTAIGDGGTSTATASVRENHA